MKQYSIATLAVALWIMINEALRTEVLLKQLWLEKFADIGLQYPEAPLNQVVWLIWLLIASASLVFLSTRLSSLQTTALIWLNVFVLGWLVIWNYGVLPVAVLYWGVPWSLAQVYIAVLLSKRLMSRS